MNKQRIEVIIGFLNDHLPAMHVHGEEDRAIPVGFAVACFKDMWPDGPVVTLPGVGHFLQEDAPESVTALIEQFIQMT